MSNIATKAMLVELVIKQWGAQRVDKAVTAAVAAQHNVSTDVGKYRKTLIDPLTLDPIKQAASNMRQYHYRMTLPWSDRGHRLLPATSYYDYMQEMQTLRMAFEQAAARFLNGYDTAKAQAQQDLGTLYNEDDYPDADTLAGRFSVALNVMPIPSGKDLRLNLNEGEVNRLREQVETQTHHMVERAVRDVYERAASVIGAFVERLSDDKNVFRDTLVENARELVELMPSLNFTDDPQITELCESMKATLCKHEPAALRTQPTAREETHARALELQKKMDNLFGGSVV